MKLTSILLILLILVTPLASQERYRKSPPFPEPLKDLNLPRIESAPLSNGLDITVAKRENLPIISIHLIILAGESSTPENLPGLATFTAEMLSKGSRNLSSSDIEEIVESIGGKFLTSTSLDYSLFSFSFLEEYLDEALEVMSKMILQPSFLRREIDNKKRTMFYELRTQKQDPEYLAKSQLFRLLFQNHPYSRTAFTEDLILNISQKDILAFYDKYYRPNNAALILVGNLNLRTAFRKVSHYLNTWKSSNLESHFLSPSEPSRKERICLVDHPQATETIINIGNIIFPRNSEDYFPFIVLNQVLGGTTGSRLFMNLRESKGFAYFAFSEVNLFRSCGVFFIRARVRPEVTYESVRECLNEIDKIIKEEITSFEIEQAKSYLIGNFPLKIETSEDFCFKIAEIKGFNLGNEYWNKYYENIMLTSSEKVFEVAQKYPLLTPVVVIVADKRKIIDHLKNFEEVEVYNNKGELQYSMTKGVEE
ncbi:MAG: M16 family metallopeptidase [Candidatus Aminicenantaceae bacterium]